MREVSSLLFGLAVGLTTLAGAQVPEPADDCRSPQIPIVDLPFSDEGDTCEQSDTMSSYGGVCTIQGVNYSGPDAIYEIVLNEGNQIGFDLEAPEEDTDFVLALLDACDDGTSCIANSPDFIGNDPEGIAVGERDPGIYYLYVDSPDPSRCGQYRLRITGENPRPPADLVIALAASANPAVAGNRLRYTLTVRNRGPADALGVVVLQEVPDKAVLVQMPPGCRTGPSGAITCSIERLGANTSRELRTIVEVLSTTRDEVVTSARIKNLTVADPDLDNNSVELRTPVVARVTLSLTKSGRPDPVTAGESLTYTLTVTNTGDKFGATEIEVTDTLDPETTNPSGDCDESPEDSGIVLCKLDALAPGESEAFEFKVAVASAAAETLENQAEVRSADNSRVRRASETTGVVRRTDLGLTMSVGSTSVAAGNVLTYTLRVTNHGPSDSTGGTLRTPQPVGLVFLPPGGRCGLTDGLLTCPIDPLSRDGSVTLRLRAQVDPSAVSDGIMEITNMASVEGNEAEPPGATEPNDASATTQVRAETDLELVTKTADPDPVVAGETLTYNLTVMNHGPSDSTGGAIVDRLNDGLTFDSSPDGCTVSDGVVTCPVGDLPRDGVAVVRFNALVASSVGSGSVIENTATVAGNEDEPADAMRSNSATSSTAVEALTDVGLTKSADPDPVIAGESVIYTLRVTNHGPSDSTGGTISDPLRDELTFESSPDGCAESAGVVTCPVGALPRNGVATFRFSALVASSTTSDSEIENTATVAGNEDEPPDATQPNQASVTTAVTAETDLGLSKSADTDQVVAGENLTYTLTVTNHGPSVSTGSTLRDELTEGLAFVSSLDGCQPGDGVVTCGVGPLAPDGTSASFRFVAAVSASVTGTIENAASVEGNEPEPQDETERNDGAVESAVETESDLAVAVVDAPDPVAPGGELRLELTVSNGGPSDATELKLIATLPNDVTFGEAPLCNQVDAPEDPEVMEVECDIPQLTVDESTTFSITGTVAANAVSPLRSEATLSAAGDPVVTVEEFTTVAAGGADLTVIQSDSIDPIVAGDRLAYSVAVVNRGPEATSFARLTDCLPIGTVFDEASSGCTLGESTIACALSDPVPGLCTLDDLSPVICTFDASDPSDERQLMVDEIMSCVITVDVGPSAIGPLVNVAEVTGENDPNGADPEAPDFNNRSEEETAVLAVAPLVLPYFEVSAGDSGTNTLLTVHNGAETEVRLRVEYFVAGEEPKNVEEQLPGHATLIVDLRDVDLPTDDLGDTTGYAAITALPADGGEPLPRAEQNLAGYFFLVDSDSGFASGHGLVDTDSSRRPPGLCRAWATRFLNGGGLAGETDFIFFTPALPDDAEPLVVGEVYTEAGAFVQEIPVRRSQRSFKIGSRQPEIDLLARFGAVEWRFRDAVGYVASVFRAGRTAVGIPGFCKEPRAEDAGGDLLLPHFGNLEELATFLAVRNAGDGEATVVPRLFGASGMELGDPAIDVTLGAHATHTVVLREEGATTGYAVVEGPSGAVLHGDAFRLERTEGLASGDALVELDPARRPPSLCRRWDVVFFHGEGFDDSEFHFFVSESDASGNLEGEIGRGQIYREDGSPVGGAVPVTLSAEERRVFTRRLDELFPNLVPDAGAIEWEFREGVTGHVSAVFTRGEYSVAVSGICRDAAGTQ